MDAIEMLKEIELFNDLEQDELELLAAACRGQSYGEGDIIFDEGDEGDSLLIVADGSAKVTKTISQGVEKDLLNANTGMMFGEMSFIDSSTRSAKAVALEDTMIISISRDEFLASAQDSTLFTKIYTKLSQTLAARLRLANNILKETVLWGLEAAGGAVLNLDKIISDSVFVKIDLIDNNQVAGKILKVEKSMAGFEITVKDEADKLTLIPYHAVTRIYF